MSCLLCGRDQDVKKKKKKKVAATERQIAKAAKRAGEKRWWER